MNLAKIWAPYLSLLMLGFGVRAHAEQPRDWMVAAQPGGTYLNVDVLFPGAQVQLEHRVPIFGQANELTLKLNALPTLVFYESQVDVDVRIVVLTLGASAGIREVFHALEFHPGQRYDSQARRDMVFAGSFGDSFASFGEARATLSLPFNENIVLLSIKTLRFEGGRDRVFDWRLGIMRDSGAVVRSDTTLFLKHRDFGAIGPRAQVLNYSLDRRQNTQVNYGLTFVTRPGLRRRNDILFISVLFAFAGTVNDIPVDEMYGMHLFKSPFNIELAGTRPPPRAAPVNQTSPRPRVLQSRCIP